VQSRLQWNGQMVGGLAIAAVSIIALINTRELDAGSLSDIGPALIPRALSVLLLVLGVAIIFAGVRAGAKGEPLEAWRLKPILAILGGIVVFGLTVRSIGIVFAAPLALMIAGFASNETRWRELAIFVFALTVFCSVLFRLVLGLPIPLAPFILGY
jgi:Tripartite tricarboxylate transporter TctB family